MTRNNIEPRFDAEEVNRRYDRIFTGSQMDKLVNLIFIIGNKIRVEYDDPIATANYVVAEFLDVTKESKKENDETEFYHGRMPRLNLLKSLPRSAVRALEDYIYENIEEFKNSKNIHLQNLAGIFFLYGFGIPKNEESALKYLEKSNLDQVKIAQTKRDPQQLFDIAECYFKNKFAVKESSNGDPFVSVIGVANYSRKADEYYEAAADLGHAQAQYVTALNNIKEKNPVKAVRLLQLAAEQGIVAASYELGKCCAGGIGIQQDVDRAISFFEWAADKQCADSQCELGKRHFKGDGVEKDHSKALKYLISAVQNDSEEAIKILSKPTKTSQLFGPMFFSVDVDSLLTPLSKDEIVNVINVMGQKQPTAARLQDANSGFIGKLVEANQKDFSLSDLFEIDQSLTQVMRNHRGGIFTACFSCEQKSLSMIHNCMFKKAENFLEEEGIRREYMAEGKINFEYRDDVGILCKFSRPHFNQSYSQILPSTNPIDEALQNKLQGFMNDDYQLNSTHFSLIFNQENSNQVISNEVIANSELLEGNNPARSIPVSTASQLRCKTTITR